MCAKLRKSCISGDEWGIEWWCEAGVAVVVCQNTWIVTPPPQKKKKKEERILEW